MHIAELPRPEPSAQKPLNVIAPIHSYPENIVDPLKTARGFAIGILLAVVSWLVLVSAVWALFQL